MQVLSFHLNARAADRVRRGYPWVFRSDVTNAKELGHFVPGMAFFADQNGRNIATGYAHPQAQLLGRILDKGEIALDHAFFMRKFSAALAWRDQLFPEPCYRLIYAESDGLPGLVIDRYGDTLVVQVNTAGMETMQDIWLPALEEVVAPKTIILKNDSTGRALEGLAVSTEILRGEIPVNGYVELIENETRFYADILKGQKTGWFYDQRPHRKWVAELSRGKTVIDIFCHSGGFGVTAGVKGAQHVTFVDISQPALELARENCKLNGLENAEFVAGKAFDVMAELAPKQYDVVSVDPPAFIKVKKDMATGLKGYEKLARLAAPLVKPGGVLFYASCSSHPSEKEMLDAIFAGTGKAGRQASLVYVGTAGPDHPMHPMMPETRYLKAFGFRVL